MLSLTSMLLNSPPSGLHGPLDPSSSSLTDTNTLPSLTSHLRPLAPQPPHLARPTIPSIPSPPTSTFSSPITPTSYPKMVLSRPGFETIVAAKDQHHLQHHQHLHNNQQQTLSSPPRSITKMMQAPQNPLPLPHHFNHHQPSQQQQHHQPHQHQHHQHQQQQQQFTKTRLRGAVRFPPCEDFDDEAVLREVRRFRVRPFGAIHTSCMHIPYNSGKKDFFEKTGRESFEVFKYEFTSPDAEMTEFSVMWDYNIGLVRMTPFFKCCQYGKTVPAKMLNLNPGLKDITHSITGGSISAQGYWMPFSCARAICATFCHRIAGALIPMFGPSFPNDCVHPDAPGFGRMVINPAIIADAARDAELSRMVHYQTNMMAAAANASLSMPSSPSGPWSGGHPLRHHNHHHLDQAIPISPPWSSTGDPGERSRHYRFKPDIPPVPFPPSQHHHFSYPPPHNTFMRPRPSHHHHLPPNYPPQQQQQQEEAYSQQQQQQHDHHQDHNNTFAPNPILSAVPRSEAPSLPNPRWTTVNTAKRPAPADAMDHDHSGMVALSLASASASASASTGSSSPTNSADGTGTTAGATSTAATTATTSSSTSPTRAAKRGIDQGIMRDLDRTADMATRKAAMLLMNLSVRDQRAPRVTKWCDLNNIGPDKAGGSGARMNRFDGDDLEEGGHRAKRRRAMSM